MAKWGEGDPRWIVEQRPDATNVNNWHWTEKNASEWSKSKLKFLLLGLKFEIPNLGTVTIETLEVCDGEASVNNRKGKLIFFYEWVIELIWVASLYSDPDKELKGKINIPNLSEENEPHEISVDVSTTVGGEVADKFKEYLRVQHTKSVQEKIGEYIEALKKEYAVDVLLPTKGQESSDKSDDVVTKDIVSNIRNLKVDTKDSASSGVALQMSDILLHQGFKCTAEEFYHTLTVREMLVAFTRSEVKIKAEVGGSFELFSGNIYGEFVSLIPFKKIVQKWRFKNWPSGHYSEVTIDIREGQGETKIDLKQIGVPTNDLERIKQGWHDYYWESIKRTFGFGAFIV